jgi:hypothetical protein
VAEKLMVALYVAGFIITTVGTFLYVRVLWRNDAARLRVASQMAWLSANIVFMMTGTKMAAIFCGYCGMLNLLIIVVGLVRRRVVWVRSQDLTCVVAVAVCLSGYFAFNEYLVLVTLLAVLANQVATWPTYQNAWLGGEKTVAMFMAAITANVAAVVSEWILNGFSLIGMAGMLVAIFGNIILTGLTFYRHIAVTKRSVVVLDAEPKLGGANA